MTDRRAIPRARAKRPDERRKGERRISPRVPMAFLVRDLKEGPSYEERHGDIGLGGIWWEGRYPPLGRKVEVRFRLPGVPQEIHASGEIIRLSESGRQLGFHMRFTQLDVESELAIAKYLEQQTGQVP